MPKLKAGTVFPTVAENKAITAAARRDPDAKPLTDAQWKAAAPNVRRGRPVGTTKVDAKVAVNLRLDPDVLAMLRASGTGWQSRVNRILRERFAL